MSDIMKAANFVQGAYNSFCEAVSDEGTMTVDNRRITYQVKGYFYRWELNYEAEVVDVATGVVGKADKSVNRDKTVQLAIQDLFSKLGLPAPTEDGSGNTAVAAVTAEAAVQQPERDTVRAAPIERQSSISFDDIPSMVHLLSFPMSGGRNVKILEQIGTNYKPFGILLLQDHTGAVVDQMTHKNQNVALQINIDILQKWRSGDAGMKPVSWQTLVDCLKTTGMTTLAEDIEQALTCS